MPSPTSTRLMTWTIAATATLGALIALTASTRDANAQAATPTPPSCSCSPPLQLAAPAGGPSVLYNCQCGGLQCVASVFAPPIKPEGNGPALVCVR